MVTFLSHARETVLFTCIVHANINMFPMSSIFIYQKIPNKNVSGNFMGLDS